jgi:predicted aldo/keto reductase-like oxidoreductase
MSRPNLLNRRAFIKTSATVLGTGWAARGGAGTEPSGPGLPDARPRIKEYRLLGRTGWKVSDIAAGFIQDEGVLGAALDAGINYMDTAEQYPGHHRLVAKVLKGRDRKSIFLTTKLQVLEDKTKAGFLARARKCLEDLETDYVDCLMMHMPENVATLKTEGFHAAMSELKAEGRVRFVGASNHGSFWYRDPEETMDKVLGAAAEDGRFDVFLLAYNFLNVDQGGRVLQACREKNIGAALMKTTPVAIYYQIKNRVESARAAGRELNPLYAEGLKRYEEKVERAQDFLKKHNLGTPEEIQSGAIRFCLDNPDVHTVCFIARTFAEMESFVRLSGERLDARTGARLEAFRDGCGDLYCRHACGACEPACPHGVPVNTIARYFQYFAGQGREREAMDLYADIPGADADRCRSCAGPCERACPHGVPIQGLLILAHDALSS